MNLSCLYGHCMVANHQKTRCLSGFVHYGGGHEKRFSKSEFYEGHK